MKLDNQKRPGWKIVVALFAGVIAVVLLWHSYLRTNATVYRTFASPDGKYKLVVYDLPQFGMAFPGQGGDGSGYVRLYDGAGRVLEEKDVEMVQNIDQVYWEPGVVDIKLFARWKLPQ